MFDIYITVISTPIKHTHTHTKKKQIHLLLCILLISFSFDCQINCHLLVLTPHIRASIPLPFHFERLNELKRNETLIECALYIIIVILIMIITN